MIDRREIRNVTCSISVENSSNNLPLHINESFTFDMNCSIQIVVTQI